MSDAQAVRIVELGSDYRIALPAEIAQRFQPADRFLVWPQGDTVILKRIAMPQVMDVVAATPETEPPLDLDEINIIVHEVRKQTPRE